MPTIVATTVVTFEAIDVAVFVTTLWTPPMSFEIRDCTSPVRVRVKNASDSRCRCRKTAARRSCITRWPTWFESSVWTTPSDAGHDRDRDHPAGGERELLVSLLADRLQHPLEQERRHDAERRPRRRSAAGRPPSRSRYGGRAADPAQVRAAHGRVGGALGRPSAEWKNMPIRSGYAARRRGRPQP